MKLVCIHCGASAEENTHNTFYVPYSCVATELRREYGYATFEISQEDPLRLSVTNTEEEDSEWIDTIDRDEYTYRCADCSHETSDLDDLFKLSKPAFAVGDRVRTTEVVGYGENSLPAGTEAEVTDLEDEEEYVYELDVADEYDDPWWVSESALELVTANQPSPLRVVKDRIEPGDIVLILEEHEGYDGRGERCVVVEVTSEMVRVETPENSDFETWWYYKRQVSLYQKADGTMVYPFQIGDEVRATDGTSIRGIVQSLRVSTGCNRCERGRETGEDRVMSVQGVRPSAGKYVCHMELVEEGVPSEVSAPLKPGDTVKIKQDQGQPRCIGAVGIVVGDDGHDRVLVDVLDLARRSYPLDYVELVVQVPVMDTKILEAALAEVPQRDPLADLLSEIS